jgi:hypothetical protein
LSVACKYQADHLKRELEVRWKYSHFPTWATENNS